MDVWMWLVVASVVVVALRTGPGSEAVGYELDAGRDHVFVPISAQVAVSGDHLLLPAEATDFARNDLFGEVVAVEARAGSIDVERVRSLGSFALMVDPDG